MRCFFCGSDTRCRGTDEPRAPRDVSGRVVFSEACARMEQLRQATTPADSVVEVVEIDGPRTVDQVAWAAEWRRDRHVASVHGDSASATPTQL